MLYMTWDTLHQILDEALILTSKVIDSDLPFTRDAKGLRDDALILRAKIFMLRSNPEGLS